jgi:hypothetical protein
MNCVNLSERRAMSDSQRTSKERVDLQKIIDQLRAAASFARNKIVMPDVESGKLMDAAASAIEYARQVADASVDVQFERGCYVLMEMMKAYERRIRSDCTTQEQLDAKPWECSEYITAARYLVKFWPPYSSTRAAEPPSAELTQVGEMIDVDDGQGTCIVDISNEMRDQMPGGTKLYARLTETKSAESP